MIALERSEARPGIAVGRNCVVVLRDGDAYRVQAVCRDDVAREGAAGQLCFTVSRVHRADQRRERVVDDERRERMGRSVVVLRV